MIPWWGPSAISSNLAIGHAMIPCFREPRVERCKFTDYNKTRTQVWAHQSPEQDLYDRCHFCTDPEAIACANRLGNNLGESRGKVVGHCGDMFVGVGLTSQ